MAPVIHSAVATISFTLIFPSESMSIYARLFSSISRPLTGHDRTVHILGSSSARRDIASPELILTRDEPPMLSNSHLYFLSLFIIAICIEFLKSHKSNQFFLKRLIFIGLRAICCTDWPGGMNYSTFGHRSLPYPATAASGTFHPHLRVRPPQLQVPDYQPRTHPPHIHDLRREPDA